MIHGLCTRDCNGLSEDGYQMVFLTNQTPWFMLGDFVSVCSFSTFYPPAQGGCRSQLVSGDQSWHFRDLCQIIHRGGCWSAAHHRSRVVYREGSRIRRAVYFPAPRSLYPCSNLFDREPTCEYATIWTALEGNRHDCFYSVRV